jgi:ketosteroid isomerase-like protein
MIMRPALSVAALCIVAACTNGQSDRTATEKALLAANDAYDRALIAGDAATLGRVYTDDFQIIDDDADLHGKRDQIELMTRTIDLLQARSDQVRVTMLGPDAALLTGRFVGRYRIGAREADFTERYTSIWMRHGGQWRLKHEHSSVVPERSN